MTAALYTVTLTDLATYSVVVAADSPKHAETVAKTLLFEESGDLPPGLTCQKRETEAVADRAGEQPTRHYDVLATYSMEFFIRVPAANAEEAERHARRIYAEEPQPFEHSTGEDRVKWHYAKEVVS